MLTKNDLAQIEQIVFKVVDPIVDNRIKSAFQDFYDNIFEPHVTQSSLQHQEIVKEIVGMKQEIKGLKDETGEIKEYIKDHDKRIEVLETTVSIKN